MSSNIKKMVADALDGIDEEKSNGNLEAPVVPLFGSTNVEDKKPSYKRDTHGASGEGWYAFDLDGTIAKYDGWKGIEHIGEPILPMISLMKKLHDEGKTVKILTARVAPKDTDDEQKKAKYYIEKWCKKNLGFVPEITHEKDALMLCLFDDRVVQVEPNTGRIIGELPSELK